MTISPVKGEEDRSTSEFLLRACHDLRTAVRSILAHAELLVKQQGSGGGAPPGEGLSFIVAGAQRIDLLVEGLVAYSIALQIDPALFQPAPMDVVVRTALAKLAREMRDNGAQATYSNLPRVPGDPDRLIQLFENLLRNALRYRGECPPTIQITAEKQGSEWLFAVRDNGPGVEADFLETMFQPFQRLDAKRHPGPGLGLTICREIVIRHGGRIWAQSSPGSGVTVFFVLPGD